MAKINDGGPAFQQTWPVHPDGRNKKIGEMTREEARAVTKAACERVREEIESPEFSAAIARAEGGAE